MPYSTAQICCVLHTSYNDLKSLLTSLAQSFSTYQVQSSFYLQCSSNLLIFLHALIFSCPDLLSSSYYLYLSLQSIFCNHSFACTEPDFLTKSKRIFVFCSPSLAFHSEYSSARPCSCNIHSKQKNRVFKLSCHWYCCCTIYRFLPPAISTVAPLFLCGLTLRILTWN